MEGVPAGRGPGRTVVPQTILGNLVGGRAPGGRPGVHLPHLAPPDALGLPDGVQEHSPDPTGQLGEGLLMSPEC